MHKNSTFESIICVSLLFALLAVSGCGNSGATPEASDASLVRPVKSMLIEATKKHEIRSFPAMIKAAQDSTLAFRVSGPLVELPVDIGQHVKKGEVIARIDDRDFSVNVAKLTASLNEAKAGLKAMKKGARDEDIARLKAELASARSRLADTKRDFERQKNLLAKQATSRSRYEKAETAMDTATGAVKVIEQELKKAERGARKEDIDAAESRIAAINAALRSAQHALNDTVLYAPFDGYIDRKHVENYETIQAGQNIITLLDLSSIEAATSVPEDVLIRQSEIIKTFCCVDAYPDIKIDALIKEVGRKTERSNQSYPLTVTLSPQTNLSIEAGMSATIYILFKPTGENSVLELPLTALFADPAGQSCVWKIDTANMHVIKTPVNVKELSKKTVHIISGVRPGDRIVTAGARFLRENQHIRLMDQSDSGRNDLYDNVEKNSAMNIQEKKASLHSEDKKNSLKSNMQEAL